MTPALTYFLLYLQMLDISDAVGANENTEVWKPKCGNGTTEKKVLKWEEKVPISIADFMTACVEAL